MTAGVIFFSHGARQAGWRLPFEAILTDFRQRCPGVPAVLTFLELMQPDFLTGVQTLVNQGVDEVRVVPLFLAPGGHTGVDLPALVEAARARWPRLHWRIEPTLTESAKIRAAIVEQAAGAD